MQGDTYRSENVIFTDLYFPQKAEGETSPLFQRAYFKVGNVDDYDAVKERIKEADIDWQQYDLITVERCVETCPQISMIWTKSVKQ